MEIITLASLAILLITTSAISAYYILTLRKFAEQERKVYHDFAKRFIAGIAGGMVVWIGGQLNTILNEQTPLETKIAETAILLVAMFFFVVLAATVFLRAERNSRLSTYLVDEGKRIIHISKCSHYQGEKTKLVGIKDSHAIELLEKEGYTKCSCVTERRPRRARRSRR